MKSTISKLYGFISKLVLMLEEEIAEAEASSVKNQQKDVKKNLTITLNKLINIIAQLNKVSKDESLFVEYTMPEDDQKIIAEFLIKYNQEKQVRIQDEIR